MQNRCIVIIGPGKHARRLLNIIKNGYDFKIKIYKHRNDLILESPFDTFEIIEKFDQLILCDAIIISTPNNMHIGYIERILREGYKGYIFCEKPPVSTWKEYELLIELDEKYNLYKRLFFNFNLFFSSYEYSIKSDKKRFSLGNLRYVNIIHSHGLAMKEIYAKNWRSSVKANPGGILEMVGSHFIAMLISILGIPTQYNILKHSASSYGDTPDNSLFSALFCEGVSVAISNSYTSPRISELTFVYENGVVRYEEDTKKVYFPRDTFDEEGRFSSPPQISEEQIGSFDMIFADSLHKSIAYFLDIANKKIDLDRKYFIAALETNKILLEGENYDR